MKKLISLTYAFLLITSTQSQTNVVSQPVMFPSKPGITIIKHPPVKDTIIKWSDARKLTWDDYLGKPPIPTPYDAGSYIELMWSLKRVNGKIIYNIYAELNTKSWVHLKSVSILNHEQLHFDLCEVYARMLRKYVAEVDNKYMESPDKTDLMSHYFYSLREMMKSEGARYDIEAKHGVDKIKQLEWQMYVTNKLKELEKYK